MMLHCIGGPNHGEARDVPDQLRPGDITYFRQQAVFDPSAPMPRFELPVTDDLLRKISAASVPDIAYYAYDGNVLNYVRKA